MATSEEIAKELIQRFVWNTALMDRERDALQELYPDNAERVNYLIYELMLLRGFAMNYATFAVLGNTPERQRILEFCYLLWEAWTAKYQAVGGETNLLADLNERVPLYTVAVKEESDLGPSYSIGRAFGRWVGYTDIALVEIAGGVFSETIRGAAKILREHS